MRRSLTTAMLTFTLLFGSGAKATTHTVKPGDDLVGVLKQLAAGDEVIVQPGTYQTSGFLEVTWKGTAQQPIVIRAATGGRPTIKGIPSENVINIYGSFFTFKGFEITGGSHGLRLGDVDHATFEDLLIQGNGDVGLSCNMPGKLCDALTIRKCEIHKTGGMGEGMYLGCNNAGCVFRNSVVEQNYVHDLGGAQGDGIEIKTGSYGNIVRDNVIVNANYPAITLYGFAAGAGKKDNIVERNLIWGTVDNGIQVVGQIIVRNNIIVNAGANGIHSKASQGHDPHHVTIVNNTVHGAGNACLKTNNWSGQQSQLAANNALYCPGKKAMDITGGAPAATFAKNVVLGSVNISSGTITGASVAADLGNPAQKVFYPPAGSKLVDAAEAKHAPADDFDGTPRPAQNVDVGAYERTGAAPKWTITFGFKGSAPPPQPDAGPGPADAAPIGDSGPAGDGPAARSDAAASDAGVTDSGGTSVDGPSGDRSISSSSDDDGCSCRVGTPPRAGSLSPLLLLLLLAIRRRRS
jgi:MYXO-CTERM domain-containing protein